MHSWAWKWLRLASGEATACTAVIWPDVQNGCSGASAGCMPKRESSGSSAAASTPMFGRARRRLASPAGTITLRPSMPPRRKMTTSVRVLGSAAKAYRVVTSWVPSAATPTAPAPAMTRRRVNPLRHWSRSRARFALTCSACDADRGLGQVRPVPAQLLELALARSLRRRAAG